VPCNKSEASVWQKRHILLWQPNIVRKAYDTDKESPLVKETMLPKQYYLCNDIVAFGVITRFSKENWVTTFQEDVSVIVLDNLPMTVLLSPYSDNC